MDTFWSAVIGAGGTITAALVPAIFARQASVRNKSYDKVTGSISNPQPDETVRRTFKCSGVVTGMQPGLSLWLAVEVGDLVWPRVCTPTISDARSDWAHGCAGRDGLLLRGLG